jgi:uncharacterized protein YdaU (DUF1376 family)
MYGQRFDSATAAWSLEETGAFVRLMNKQWDAGYIPDDMGELARIIRCSTTKTRSLWRRLADKFPLCEDGLRRNPLLSSIRCEREDYSREQSRKGKSGASRRYGNGDSNGHGNGDSNCNSLPSSSFLSPSPPSQSPKERAPRSVAPWEPIPARFDTPAVRAGIAGHEQMRKRRRVEPNQPESWAMRWRDFEAENATADEVAAAFAESIKNGWRGVFFKKGQQSAGKSTRRPIEAIGPDFAARQRSEPSSYLREAAELLERRLAGGHPLTGSESESLDAYLAAFNQPPTAEGLAWFNARLAGEQE